MEYKVVKKIIPVQDKPQVQKYTSELENSIIVLQKSYESLLESIKSLENRVDGYLIKVDIKKDCEGQTGYGFVLCKAVERVFNANYRIENLIKNFNDLKSRVDDITNGFNG